MKKALSLFLVLLLSLSFATAASAAHIVYWTMWDSPEAQGQAIQKAIDQYTADTGNTVDIQYKGRTGQREGLQPALDAGTVIDLFDEDIDRVNRTWVAYLADLEELAKAKDYEATAIGGLMSAAREAAGGTLKSIPYQPNVFNFFYNQAIFDEVGITEAPATWDAFLDVCEKVKGAGYIPVTCDDAYILCLLGYHMARYVGDKGVEEIVTNGDWAENEAVLKSAEAFADMAAKGYFSPTISSAVWPINQNGELALGMAAMYLNGSWLPNEVLPMTGPDFVWGCFPYPAVEGGAFGVESANYGAQVLAINKDSEVKAEAFDLICYITKGEFDALMSQMSVGIPADTTNVDWPVMLQSVKPIMDSLTTRFTWAAGIEANVNMTPIIKENLQKLCGGQISAQEFVDALEAASK